MTAHITAYEALELFEDFNPILKWIETMDHHVTAYKKYPWSLMTEKEREWVKAYGGFRFVGQAIELLDGRMR